MAGRVDEGNHGTPPDTPTYNGNQEIIEYAIKMERIGHHEGLQTKLTEMVVNLGTSGINSRSHGKVYGQDRIATVRRFEQVTQMVKYQVNWYSTIPMAQLFLPMNHIKNSHKIKYKSRYADNLGDKCLLRNCRINAGFS